MKDPTMREYLDEIAHAAQWDKEAQLDLALEFLEDYDLADQFVAFATQRAQGGADEHKVAGHRLHSGECTGAGCPEFSAVCSGWGLALGPAGTEISVCTRCQRFATNLHAVTHILACAHCTQLARAFRRERLAAQGQGGQTASGVGGQRRC